MEWNKEGGATLVMMTEFTPEVEGRLVELTARSPSRVLPKLLAIPFLSLALLSSPLRGRQTIAPVPVAGAGQGAYSGDNGPAILANLSSPSGVAIDCQG